MVSEAQFAVQKGGIDVTNLRPESRFRTLKGFRLIAIPKRNANPLQVKRAIERGLPPKEFNELFINVSMLPSREGFDPAKARLEKLARQKLKPATIRGLENAGVLSREQARRFKRAAAKGVPVVTSVGEARAFQKRQEKEFKSQLEKSLRKAVKQKEIRPSQAERLFRTSRSPLTLREQLKREGLISPKTRSVTPFTLRESLRRDGLLPPRVNFPYSPLKDSFEREVAKNIGKSVPPGARAKEVTIRDIIPEDISLPVYGKGTGASSKEIIRQTRDFFVKQAKKYYPRIKGLRNFRRVDSKEAYLDRAKGVGTAVGVLNAVFEPAYRLVTFGVQEELKKKGLPRTFDIPAPKGIRQFVRKAQEENVPFISGPLQFVTVGGKKILVSRRAVAEGYTSGIDLALLILPFAPTKAKLVTLSRKGKPLQQVAEVAINKVPKGKGSRNFVRSLNVGAVRSVPSKFKTSNFKGFTFKELKSKDIPKGVKGITKEIQRLAEVQKRRIQRLERPTLIKNLKTEIVKLRSEVAPATISKKLPDTVRGLEKEISQLKKTKAKTAKAKAAQKEVLNLKQKLADLRDKVNPLINTKTRLPTTKGKLKREITKRQNQIGKITGAAAKRISARRNALRQKIIKEAIKKKIKLPAKPPRSIKKLEALLEKIEKAKTRKAFEEVSILRLQKLERDLLELRSRVSPETLNSPIPKTAKEMSKEIRKLERKKKALEKIQKKTGIKMKSRPLSVDLKRKLQKRFRIRRKALQQTLKDLRAQELKIRKASRKSTKKQLRAIDIAQEKLLLKENKLREINQKMDNVRNRLNRLRAKKAKLSEKAFNKAKSKRERKLRELEKEQDLARKDFAKSRRLLEKIEKNVAKQQGFPSRKLVKLRLKRRLRRGLRRFKRAQKKKARPPKFLEGKKPSEFTMLRLQRRLAKNIAKLRGEKSPVFLARKEARRARKLRKKQLKQKERMEEAERKATKKEMDYLRLKRKIEKNEAHLKGLDSESKIFRRLRRKEAKRRAKATRKGLEKQFEERVKSVKPEKAAAKIRESIGLKGKSVDELNFSKAVRLLRRIDENAAKLAGNPTQRLQLRKIRRTIARRARRVKKKRTGEIERAERELEALKKKARREKKGYLKAARETKKAMRQLDAPLSLEELQKIAAKNPVAAKKRLDLINKKMPRGQKAVIGKGGTLQITKTKAGAKPRTPSKPKIRGKPPKKPSSLPSLFGGGKPKLKIVTSTIAGRRVITGFKTDQSGKINLNDLVAVKGKPLVQLKTGGWVRLAPKTVAKLKEIILTKTKPEMATGLKPKLATALKPLLKLTPGEVTRVTEPLKTKVPPKKRLFLDLPQPTLQKFIMAAKKSKQPVNVFVKRRGKLVKVNRKPLKPTSALALGHQFAERTPSRSIIIRKGKGKPASLKLKPLPPNQYRKRKGKSKLPQGTLVEKAKYAINTKGEKSGITMKGIAARITEKNKGLRRFINPALLSRSSARTPKKGSSGKKPRKRPPRSPRKPNRRGGARRGLFAFGMRIV